MAEQETPEHERTESPHGVPPTASAQITNSSEVPASKSNNSFNPSESLLKQWGKVGLDRKIELALVFVATLFAIALFCLTKNAADFTRDVVERPYVVMSGLHPENIESGKTPRFIVEFRNTGRTPADVSVDLTLQERIDSNNHVVREQSKAQDLRIPGGLSGFVWISWGEPWSNDDVLMYHVNKTSTIRRTFYVTGSVQYIRGNYRREECYEAHS